MGRGKQQVGAGIYGTVVCGACSGSRFLVKYCLFSGFRFRLATLTASFGLRLMVQFSDSFHLLGNGNIRHTCLDCDVFHNNSSRSPVTKPIKPEP